MLRLGEIVIVVLAVSLSACSYERDATVDFASVFGPQELPPMARLFSGQSSDDAIVSSDPRLDSYAIRLRVVRGRDLRLDEGVPLVTLVEGRPTSVERIEPLPERAYVHGTIDLQSERGGWNLYTVVLRVTSGPLAGALIDLRDGRVSDAGSDHQAVYELPASSEIEDGDLEHEVAWVFMK